MSGHDLVELTRSADERGAERPFDPQLAGFDLNLGEGSVPTADRVARPCEPDECAGLLAFDNAIRGSCEGSGAPKTPGVGVGRLACAGTGSNQTTDARNLTPMPPMPLTITADQLTRRGRPRKILFGLRFERVAILSSLEVIGAVPIDRGDR